MLIGKLHQGFCNFTFIKSFAFGFGNGTQASRSSFELKQFADIGSTSPWQKAFCKTRQGLQERCGGKPFLLHDHRQQIATLGNFNGRLHQVGKGQFAKAIAEGHPGTDSARHCDGVPAALGRIDGVCAIFFVKVFWRPRLWRRT